MAQQSCYCERDVLYTASTAWHFHYSSQGCPKQPVTKEQSQKAHEKFPGGTFPDISKRRAFLVGVHWALEGSGRG